MLPDSAHLLDLAGRLTGANNKTTSWFSRFALCSGVDDSRTVFEHCNVLIEKLREQREAVIFDLKRANDDPAAIQIYNGWLYTLETMMQEAHARTTCTWMVEGSESLGVDGSSGGNITLRRV